MSYKIYPCDISGVCPYASLGLGNLTCKVHCQATINWLATMNWLETDEKENYKDDIYDEYHEDDGEDKNGHSKLL